MAELDQNIRNSSKNTRDFKKILPKVDLTAMVDLAFLLITFFMLTTSLSKPSAMSVSMPVDAGDLPVSEDRAMTVCLGKNDQVLLYMGTSDNPHGLQLVKFSEIRLAFQKQMQQVPKLTGKNLVVLIKPSEKSKFKNLVDLLDEIDIVKVPSYAIIEITSKDKEMLTLKGAF